MTDTQKLILNSQAQAILAQLDTFSKVVKYSTDILGIEKEYLLEALQAPYKNMRYVMRKINQMSR
jgi:hypothetical protein